MLFFGACSPAAHGADVTSPGEDQPIDRAPALSLCQGYLSAAAQQVVMLGSLTPLAREDYFID